MIVLPNSSLINLTILINIINLINLVTIVYLIHNLIFFHIFRRNYCKIKWMWTVKNASTLMKHRQRYFCLQISKIYVTFSGWWFSKFSQLAKPFSKLTQSHKYCLNWYHFDVFISITRQVFIYFYVLEESEVVTQKSSIKRCY